MTTPTLDRESILSAISRWPQHEQIAIAGEILRRAGILHEESGTSGASQLRTDTDAAKRSHNLADIAGIFTREGQEPPTDEEVARLLEERRTEKYER